MFQQLPSQVSFSHLLLTRGGEGGASMACVLFPSCTCVLGVRLSLTILSILRKCTKNKQLGKLDATEDGTQ